MFLLVLLFILVPLVELYVIIQVGGAIGVVPTLAILVADSLLGALLLRQQGRGAWVRFNRALNESRMPHKEVMDGVLIIFGGALLLTPGFITDIFGLVLLIPPTRTGVRAFMARMVRGRLAMGPRAAIWSFGRARDSRSRRRPGPKPGAGAPPADSHAAASDPYAWEDAHFPGRARSRGPQPGDIEGTGHEVGDADGLPPAGTEPPRSEPPSREEPPRR